MLGQLIPVFIDVASHGCVALLAERQPKACKRCIGRRTSLNADSRSTSRSAHSRSISTPNCNPNARRRRKVDGSFILSTNSSRASSVYSGSTRRSQRALSPMSPAICGSPRDFATVLNRSYSPMAVRRRSSASGSLRKGNFTAWKGISCFRSDCLSSAGTVCIRNASALTRIRPGDRSQSPSINPLAASNAMSQQPFSKACSI